MTVQLNISDVILQPELNAAQITITPIFSSGVPDVNKQYVDEGLDLKVDKVEFSHENLTGKNSEAAVQHIDTTVTKEALDEADKVALFDSVTGKVVLSNALNDIETILASI